MHMLSFGRPYHQLQLDNPHKLKMIYQLLDILAEADRLPSIELHLEGEEA